MGLWLVWARQIIEKERAEDEAAKAAAAAAVVGR